MTNPTAFDPAKVTIDRKRFSVTQGEVLLSYDGTKIEQYGDSIALMDDGQYQGYSDEFWIATARSEAIARGLATDPTKFTIDLTPTWEGMMPAIIAVLQNGSAKGQAIAIEELMKLAKSVDAMNATTRAELAAKENHTAPVSNMIKEGKFPNV